LNRFKPLLLVTFLFIFIIGTEFFLRFYKIKTIKKSSFLISIFQENKKTNTKFIKPEIKQKVIVLTDTLNKSVINDTLFLKDFGTDSLKNIELFFEKIKNKQKKIRVAYFGDSMIEGDLVTQDLRKSFQDWLGGFGVGFVPITSITAGFRQTIIHKFSENWSNTNLVDYKRNTEFPPGISGYTYLANSSETAYAEYTAVYREKLNSLKNFRLFYGKTNKEFNLKLNFNKRDSTTSLMGTDLFNEFSLGNKFEYKKIKLEISAIEKFPIYGCSFESDSGFIIDNFAFRGNSGLPLTKIPLDLLKASQEKLQYDLIIFHYGLNVISEKSEDYNWYKIGMEQMLSYFKRAFPNTSFLLISVSDKSYVNEEGKYETIPSLENLVEMQENLAKEKNMAFFNLYQSMGGFNSMVNWADSIYPLANKDYTHLNFRGSKKVSNLIFYSLKNNYEQWEKK
jgi:hypothetical protein